MKLYLLAGLSVCGLISVGCDSDEGNGAGAAAMNVGCAWKDFDATVRSGPSAGTALRGRLVLAAAPDSGDLYGHLFVGDGTAVPVSGSRSADNVSLSFHSELGTIEGNGPIANMASFCKEGLEGELSGPTDGDEGDWLGAGLVSYDMDEYDGIVDPPPAGLGNDGVVDVEANRELSPGCSQNGTKITCSTVSGSPPRTTTCTTNYGLNPPSTTCSTIGGSRPGVEQE